MKLSSPQGSVASKKRILVTGVALGDGEGDGDGHLMMGSHAGTAQ